MCRRDRYTNESCKDIWKILYFVQVSLRPLNLYQTSITKILNSLSWLPLCTFLDVNNWTCPLLTPLPLGKRLYFSNNSSFAVDHEETFSTLFAFRLSHRSPLVQMKFLVKGCLDPYSRSCPSFYGAWMYGHRPLGGDYLSVNSPGSQASSVIPPFRPDPLFDGRRCTGTPGSEE